MKRIVTYIMVLFLIIANAVSAEEKLATKETEHVDFPLDEQTIAKEDNSLNNRSNKKYQFTVGIGNEYSITAYIFTAAYFLDPSQIITFRYSRINQDDEIDAVSNELQKLKAFTVGYKKFLGNSFNIQPTLYYRQSSTDYIKEGVIKSVGTPNLIFNDIGVGIKIGNEWQWDNFVLGVDWIGLNNTIYKIKSQTAWQGTPQTIQFLRETSLTIVSFYLGVTF